MFVYLFLFIHILGLCLFCVVFASYVISVLFHVYFRASIFLFVCVFTLVFYVNLFILNFFSIPMFSFSNFHDCLCILGFLVSFLLRDGPRAQGLWGWAAGPGGII